MKDEEMRSKFVAGVRCWLQHSKQGQIDWKIRTGLADCLLSLAYLGGKEFDATMRGLMVQVDIWRRETIKEKRGHDEA